MRSSKQHSDIQTHRQTVFQTENCFNIKSSDAPTDFFQVSRARVRARLRATIYPYLLSECLKEVKKVVKSIGQRSDRLSDGYQTFRQSGVTA